MVRGLFMPRREPGMAYPPPWLAQWGVFQILFHLFQVVPESCSSFWNSGNTRRCYVSEVLFQVFQMFQKIWVGTPKRLPRWLEPPSRVASDRKS